MTDLVEMIPLSVPRQYPVYCALLDKCIVIGYRWPCSINYPAVVAAVNFEPRSNPLTSA